MHVLLIILEVLGGLLALAVILAALFAVVVTQDGGNNPFQ